MGRKPTASLTTSKLLSCFSLSRSIREVLSLLSIILFCSFVNQTATTQVPLSQNSSWSFILHTKSTCYTILVSTKTKKSMCFSEHPNLGWYSKCHNKAFKSIALLRQRKVLAPQISKSFIPWTKNLLSPYYVPCSGWVADLQHRDLFSEICSSRC